MKIKALEQYIEKHLGFVKVAPTDLAE